MTKVAVKQYPAIRPCLNDSLNWLENSIMPPNRFTMKDTHKEPLLKSNYSQNANVCLHKEQY